MDHAQTSASTRDAVAAEVRATAARYRYNQTRVARVLGCSQAAVSRKYLAQVPFDVDELERLAREWNVPITAFFPRPADSQATTEGYLGESIPAIRTAA